MASRLKTKYRIVYLKALDHWSASGWLTPKEAEFSMPILESVGFLVYEDKNQYVLCATMDMSDDASTQRKGVLKKAVIEKRFLT